MKNVIGIRRQISICFGKPVARIFAKGFRRFICLQAAALIWILPTASQAAAATTFLHTRGQDIVNEQNEKILLRGVGLGNWMLPEGYMWKFGNQGDRPRRIEKLVSDLIGPENGKHFWSEFRKKYITEADIQRIAELGFNSVRPALNSRLFLSETGISTGTEEGFLLLDNLIAWSKAHGVYVIIDMHGAPGGQTGQNIDDSANDQPELFMERKYQDQLVSLWQAIARRYKDEPTVAGYDLLNEPLPERTGAAKTFKSQLEPLYKRLTQAIREIDPKHIIILEGADWSNDWSVFSKPFDPNLVYQFHYYCWDNPPILKNIQRFLDYRDRFNAPVWVGETGEKNNAIYWATTEYFEANNIGWSFWPWKKMDSKNTPFSIKLPADWAAVAAYSRGGERPAREVAQKAFDELLTNIRLENCTYYPDVVNALLRRAPVRIEAENYGPAGPGISYGVKDSARRSQYYRLGEAVPVKLSDAQNPRSDQIIALRASEWTAYQFESRATQIGTIVLRVRAEVAPAKAQLQVNGQTLEVAVSEKSWTEIKLNPIQFQRGINQLKWTVQQGAIELDWLDVQLPDESKQAVGIKQPATTN